MEGTLLFPIINQTSLTDIALTLINTHDILLYSYFYSSIRSKNIAYEHANIATQRKENSTQETGKYHPQRLHYFRLFNYGYCVIRYAYN